MFISPIPGTVFYALVTPESVFPLTSREAGRISCDVPFESWYGMTDEEQNRVYHAYMVSDLRARNVVQSRPAA